MFLWHLVREWNLRVRKQLCALTTGAAKLLCTLMLSCKNHPNTKSTSFSNRKFC